MQARTECLAWINRDDGVARGGGVLAPWWSNDDATHAQNWELSTPARRPLFGGDWSYKEWPNAAQANTAT
jgi:hypothetical protein